MAAGGATVAARSPKGSSAALADGLKGLGAAGLGGGRLVGLKSAWMACCPVEASSPNGSP